MDSLCEDDDAPNLLTLGEEVAPRRVRLGDEDGAAKRQILERLAALGIASCEMEYNGSDGMRSMHGCHGAGPDGKPLLVPADVDSLVEDFVGRTLSAHWDDELGSFGTVTFDVNSGRVVYDHWVREVEEVPRGWEA